MEEDKTGFNTRFEREIYYRFGNCVLNLIFKHETIDSHTF